LIVAAMVIVFGAYRIRLSLVSLEEAEKRKERRGLFGLPRRTHAIIGVLYLLLGIGLIATAMGWNPLGGLFASPPSPPAVDKPPEGGVLIEPK
jgi:hypothetical protein